jgi:hypothetical protein
MATVPLRGVKKAVAFLRVYDLLKTNMEVVGNDRMIDVNNVILYYYMQAVKEDPRTRTGLSYLKGRNDEWVRKKAQEQLGFPVGSYQVIMLRRFLASLFKGGRSSVQDIIRIRRMFFGKLATE